MERLLISLYDHSEVATAVMQALHDEGFKNSEIDCIESPPQDDHLYRRPLFSDGRGSIIHAESAHRGLSNMGIPAEDTDEYVEAIQKGHSLIVVRCDEHRASTARDIMNRIPVEFAARTQAEQKASIRTSKQEEARGEDRGSLEQ